MNYWKQLSHVMMYFRADEDDKAKLPKSFIGGFLEVRSKPRCHEQSGPLLTLDTGTKLKS